MIAPGLVWVAVAAFALAGGLVALVAARGNRGTAADYYLAGGRLGGLVAGLSYAATTYSAFMLVVLTGLTYRGGIGALGFELIYFAGLALLVVFGPRFWLASRRWGFITPAEMLGARYGDAWVARLAALVGLVFLLPYCTTQLAGVGLLLSGATGGAIGLGAAVAVGAALAALWTLAAGLRSVAWTDAGLAVLMLVSSLLAVGFAVAALGGADAFAGRLLAERPEWLDVPGPGLWTLPGFVALSLPWFFFPLSNPQVAQRLFVVRDLAALRRMILWVLGFGLVFTLVAVTWGFAALLLVPDLSDSALATPALLATDAIPIWVALPLVVGILSAAVSTLDSIALTLGATVARDLLPRRREHDAREVLVGRLMVVAVLALAGLFAVREAAVVETLAALSAAGLLSSVPATVGAFFWRGGTAWGARASLAGGAATAAGLAWGAGVGVFDPALALGTGGVSAVLFVGVSAMTRPRPAALAFADELRPDLDRLRVW